MCFHTKQTKKAQTVSNKFDAKMENIDTFKPSNHYNGFDFPKTPIITNEAIHKIQMVNWGLMPFWTDASWDKSFTLNAKIETLHEKKSFKEIINNRCIVIVDGFYEWQHIDNQKIKFEIGFDNQLFALAGLFDINKDYKSYTIVTTEAQGVMRKIHHTKLRMPIALKTKEQMHNWLNGKEVNPSFDFTTQAKDNFQMSLF